MAPPSGVIIKKNSVQVADEVHCPVCHWPFGGSCFPPLVIPCSHRHSTVHLPALCGIHTLSWNYHPSSDLQVQLYQKEWKDLRDEMTDHQSETVLHQLQWSPPFLGLLNNDLLEPDAWNTEERQFWSPLCFPISFYLYSKSACKCFYQYVYGKQLWWFLKN